MQLGTSRAYHLMCTAGTMYGKQLGEILSPKAEHGLFSLKMTTFETAFLFYEQSPKALTHHSLFRVC